MKTTVNDAVWRKIYNLVRKVDGASVRVGIPSGELAEIGMIHEFGAPAANIPERSFIRATFRAKRSHLIALQAKIATLLIAGKIDERQAMDMLGANLAYAIRETITATGDFAPLKPATIKAKGGITRPLVSQSETLVHAITWVIVP